MLDVLRSTASDHHVEIIEGSSDHLEEEILKGHLDMGFFPEPIHHEDINFVPIYEEEVYFAHAAENKDAAALIKHAWDGKSLNLAPFRDLPFIMLRKGLKFHDLTQRLCREYDFFPKAIYESDNLDTVYSLVNHNYGVAFLPSTLLPVLTKRQQRPLLPPRLKKRPAPHRHCLPRDKIQGKEDAGPGEGDQKPVTWRANFAKLMAQCPVTICYAGA